MFRFNRKPQQNNPIDASADNTVRTLSDTECRQVAGGYGKTCHYSYSEDRSASYTSSSGERPD